MKTRILKSIIMMMVAFAPIGAGAQRLINAVEVIDSLAVSEMFKSTPSKDAIQTWGLYLRENTKDTLYLKPKETIMKGDSLLIDCKVFMQSPKMVRHINYKTENSLDSVKRKAAATLAKYELTDDSCRRDVIGYKILSGDKFVGIAIKKTADKNGFGVQAEASYQMAPSLYGFSGKIGGMYASNYLMVETMLGLSRTRYSDNAVHAGEKYLAFCSQVGLGCQPFRFDHYNKWRLWFNIGAGWEKYWSDSRKTIVIMNSEGNYFYPYAGIQLEYRFFATGNSLYAKAQWRQKKWIIQNADREVSNALEFSVGCRIGVGRNRLNH